jgi:hypothetical protein
MPDPIGSIYNEMTPEYNLNAEAQQMQMALPSTDASIDIDHEPIFGYPDEEFDALPGIDDQNDYDYIRVEDYEDEELLRPVEEDEDEDEYEDEDNAERPFEIPDAPMERDYQELNPGMDEGHGILDIELYEGAAWITGRVEPPFAILLQSQLKTGLNNMYYPFASEKEWKLAGWMHGAGLSRRQIDSYLHLNQVSMLKLLLAYC